jgi:NADPH-dependent glutamate synthase beta subunit-like oxidoreductase
VLDRRLAQMRDEGTRFVTSCEVGGAGKEGLPTYRLRAEFDAVVLAVAVDSYLTGSPSRLPAPVHPTALPLMA